jgi:hypothetical protein
MRKIKTVKKPDTTENGRIVEAPATDSGLVYVRIDRATTLLVTPERVRNAGGVVAYRDWYIEKLENARKRLPS